VSTNGYPVFPAVPPEESFYAEPYYYRPRHRYWLHALLLLVTLLTTSVMGTGMARGFASGRPFEFDSFAGYLSAWHHPSTLLTGLPFALTLLAVLLAHEFGHYCAARYYGVDATLPFFLPAPTLIGTLGAFIKIRSAILSKRILFDIGIAGPLAGFAVLVWPLIIGVSLSKVSPGIAVRGDLVFGTPLVLRVFEWIAFPGVPVTDIYLHPVARAAWVGLLATALNLLPIGQLDGGHILYSFVGEHAKLLSRIFVVALAALACFQLFTTSYRSGWSWLVWAAIILFFGMRHPAIVDPVPLGRGRSWLGLVALIVLALSFTVAPVHTTGL
jgi:membrane-associated protease RseP (regulator of RpoE activity)